MLSGLFTVNSEGWIPMRLPPPPPNATPAVNPFAGLPTIFTVLGKLGLELERNQDILPVYSMKRIERPAANRRSRSNTHGLATPLISANVSEREPADAITVAVPQKWAASEWSWITRQPEVGLFSQVPRRRLVIPP